MLSFNDKICICVSTHSSSRTPPARLDTIRRCLQSLCDHVVPMYPHARVCVTADTVNAQHQSILDAFPFPVVSNAENMGIAYTKNVGIDQMMKGDYTHGFLMDDDLIIKDGRVFHMYVDAMTRARVGHLSLKVGCHNHTAVEHRGVLFVTSAGVNGCLLAMDRQCILTAGYMEIPVENKNGHEHTKFSLRALHKGCVPGLWDVKEVFDDVHSFFDISQVSAHTTWDQQHQNAKHVHTDLHKVFTGNANQTG